MTVLLAGCGEGEESSASAVSGEESKAGSSVTEKDIRATNLLKGVTVRDVDFTAVERPYHPLMTDLAVKLAHQAGQLQVLLSKICAAGIDIEYTYALATGGDDASIIIKPADLEKAEEILKQTEVEVMDSGELSQL
jgi:hypothetical protein